MRRWFYPDEDFPRRPRRASPEFLLMVVIVASCLIAAIFAWGTA